MARRVERGVSLAAEQTHVCQLGDTFLQKEYLNWIPKDVLTLSYKTLCKPYAKDCELQTEQTLVHEVWTVGSSDVYSFYVLRPSAEAFFSSPLERASCSLCVAHWAAGRGLWNVLFMMDKEWDFTRHCIPPCLLLWTHNRRRKRKRNATHSLFWLQVSLRLRAALPATRM